MSKATVTVSLSGDQQTHLRDQQTGRVGGAQHVDEEVVGQHVQLLDLLALDVGVPGRPEEV